MCRSAASRYPAPKILPARPACLEPQVCPAHLGPRGLQVCPVLPVCPVCPVCLVPACPALRECLVPVCRGPLVCPVRACLAPMAALMARWQAEARGASPVEVVATIRSETSARQAAVA